MNNELANSYEDTKDDKPIIKNLKAINPKPKNKSLMFIKVITNQT